MTGRCSEHWPQGYSDDRCPACRMAITEPGEFTASYVEHLRRNLAEANAEIQRLRAPGIARLTRRVLQLRGLLDEARVEMERDNRVDPCRSREELVDRINAALAEGREDEGET